MLDELALSEGIGVQALPATLSGPRVHFLQTGTVITQLSETTTAQWTNCQTISITLSACTYFDVVEFIVTWVVF